MPCRGELHVTVEPWGPDPDAVEEAARAALERPAAVASSGRQPLPSGDEREAALEVVREHPELGPALAGGRSASPSPGTAGDSHGRTLAPVGGATV